MMPVDPEDQRALALAQSAMQVAQDAKREAAETREAMRSIYIALGDMAAQMKRLAAAQEHFSEELAAVRVIPRSVPPPPPMRERAPSVHELAEEVAAKVSEKTGSHIVMPSQRVAAIVERERNRVIAAGLVKVVAVLLPLILGALFGHLAWK